MTLYEVLLFVHILAVAVWVGGSIMLGLISARVQRTGDAAFRARFAEGAAAQRRAIAAALRRADAGHLQLRTDRDWLMDVVRFVADRRRAGSGGASR
jgi:hypothetical protein